MDILNHRIQFFLTAQSIDITIADVTNVFDGNSTLLYTLYTVTLANQLKLYVIDAGNHRIQKCCSHC